MVNDMTIIFSIVTLFIAVGFITPMINDEFGGEYDTNSPDYIKEQINQDDIESTTSSWKIIISVFSMFFWTFGALPVWLETLIFLPLRIILAFIIARNIWIGGGS